MSDNDKIYRPPIVTIMGHVDHGKTSLLDAIRDTNKAITATESGGITQHTGAYTVTKNGKKIVFIDTPGHEAFTEMRARGGSAADIVILVVAADDGVMPQTKEAIMHAKAANVPIIVAINKIDLPGANVHKVKRQLSENGILVEGYGGDVVAVEVSAKVGTGISDLLDVIALISEMNLPSLSVDGNKLNALTIESEEDRKKGKLVHVVVRSGSLAVKDKIVAGGLKAVVKALIDVDGKNVKEALPGDAVSILGFSSLPISGDVVYREDEVDPSMFELKGLDTGNKDILLEVSDSSMKKLNIVVRADTVGTLEAVVGSLRKLKVEDANVNVLFSGVGDVKESDILLASTGRGVVIAFRVGTPKSVIDISKENKVIVRSHDIIYELIEEIEGALEGVLEVEESKIKGRGLIIQVFTLPKSQTKIAGTLIEAGKFKKNSRIGLFRGDKNDVPLYVSRIKSIHEGAKEVDVSGKGSECGLLFKPPIEDLQLDDRLEVL